MEVHQVAAAKHDGRNRLFGQVLLLLISTMTILLVAGANGAIYHMLGRVLTEVELHRVLSLLAPICVGWAFVAFLHRDRGEMPGVARMRARAEPVLDRIGSAIAGLPTWFLLAEIIIVSAGARIALDRETTVPRVFGDELIYSSLAKSFAATGELAVRGTPTIDYSVLYPIAISVAYALAEDGVTAFATIKVMNAIFAAVAAIPTYLLARMVVERGWALLTATLAAVGPPAAYSALVMTESLFYPLLILFVYVLARTLERPSVTRQLATLGTIAVLFPVRQQAAILVAALVTAMLALAIASGSKRATLRQYTVTWAVLSVLLAAVAAVSLRSDGRSLLGAYGVLVRGYEPVDAITWTMRHLALLEISVGVVAALAVPLALGDLMRRPLDRRQAGFAIAVGTTIFWLLVSVVALSASPWGLDSLHERSLFYVVPLMVASFAYWLSAGMPRPRRMTISVAAIGIAAPLFLAGEYVHETTIDAVSIIPWAETWARLDLEAVPLVRVLAAIVGLGTVVFLLARRPLLPVVLLLVTFVVVIGAVHRANGPARAINELGWVDARLGDRASVTFVHIPVVDGTCSNNRAVATGMLAVYTEFFNESVTRVAFLREPLGFDGLGYAARLEVGSDGVLRSRGRQLEARYVVLDSRIRITGRPLDRIEASSILKRSGSLTLWETAGRVRFERVPKPRSPAQGCDSG